MTTAFDLLHSARYSKFIPHDVIRGSLTKGAFPKKNKNLQMKEDLYGDLEKFWKD